MPNSQVSRWTRIFHCRRISSRELSARLPHAECHFPTLCVTRSNGRSPRNRQTIRCLPTRLCMVTMALLISHRITMTICTRTRRDFHRHGRISGSLHPPPKDKGNQTMSQDQSDQPASEPQSPVAATPGTPPAAPDPSGVPQTPSPQSAAGPQVIQKSSDPATASGPQTIQFSKDGATSNNHSVRGKASD